jgi:hypothetical protein
MSPESKAMADILLKLQNVQQRSEVKSNNSNNSESPGNVSPDTQEMWKILNRLQQATESATLQVVEDIHNGTSIAVMRNENTVGVGKYNIVIEDTIVSGFKKKYYHIHDGDSAIYNGISLFETAMGIVKQLTHTCDLLKVKKLIELDSQYDSNLVEAAIQKKRSKSLTESARADVASAKHSNAVAKMSYIKKQIKSLL